MSREARRWVWEEAPVDDPRQMLILLSLADVADQNGGNAYPSVARLAKDSRSSDRSVQRHLKLMVEAGILEVVQKATQHRPTTYCFVDLRDDNLSPLKEQPPKTAYKPQGRHRGDTGVTNREVAPITGTGSGKKPGAAIAAVDESDVVEGKPLAPAQALAVLAMEQPIKPVLRSGDNPFLAVRSIMQRLLDAGHPEERLRQAIVSGIEVWTLAGVQTAMAHLDPPKGRGGDKGRSFIAGKLVQAMA